MAFLLINGGTQYTGSTRVSLIISGFGLGFTPTTIQLKLDTNPFRTPIAFTNRIGTYDLVETGVHTIVARLSDGVGTTDLTETITVVDVNDPYVYRSETAQIIANKLPDHSPIRNRRDSNGQKFIDAFAPEVENTNDIFNKMVLAPSLERINIDEPDLLYRVELPSDLQGNFTPAEYNIIRNGAFTVNDANGIRYWDLIDSVAINTSNPIIGRYSTLIDPPVNEKGIIHQQLDRQIKQGTILNLSVGYSCTSTGVIAATAENKAYLIILYENRTHSIHSVDLNTATNGIALAKLSATTTTRAIAVHVIVVGESDNANTIELNVGFINLSMNANTVWAESLDTFPHHFRTSRQPALDFSAMGMLPVSNQRDFWYDAIPTRLEKRATYKAITDLVTVLPTELNRYLLEEATIGFTGQTVFVLAQTQSDTKLFYQGQFYEEGTDYTIVGTTLTWSGTDRDLYGGYKFYLLTDADYPKFNYYSDLLRGRNRYDRFRDSYSTYYRLNRAENNILWELVTNSNDVIGTYSSMGLRTSEEGFREEDWPRIHAMTSIHGRLVLLVRESGSDTYQVLFLNSQTSEPQPEYLEVVWAGAFTTTHDLTFVSIEFLEGDQQILYAYTNDEAFQIRLYYDYVALEANGREIYLRESPPNGILIAPLFAGEVARTDSQVR